MASAAAQEPLVCKLGKPSRAIGCELLAYAGEWDVQLQMMSGTPYQVTIAGIAAQHGWTDEWVDAAFAKFRWRQRSSTVRALSEVRVLSNLAGNSDLAGNRREKLTQGTIRRRRFEFEAHSHLEE